MFTIGKLYKCPNCQLLLYPTLENAIAATKLKSPGCDISTVHYPELGFRPGDLVQVREDIKEEVIFYTGTFGQENTTKNPKSFTAKNGYLLYIGCMINEDPNLRRPRMVFHFLINETVWHTFFWNCHGASQCLAKVKVKAP